MYRCATVSEGELDLLRGIEHVVRGRHVVHIGTDEIVLSEGSIATDRGQVHVDCSAAGLHVAPGAPDLRARPDHVAAGPHLPADVQRRPARVRGVDRSRRRRKEPALSAQPVSRRRHRLDRRQRDQRARPGRLAAGARPRRVARPLPARCRSRARRPHDRAARAVCACPLREQRRAGGGQPRRPCSPGFGRQTRLARARFELDREPVDVGASGLQLGAHAIEPGGLRSQLGFELADADGAGTVRGRRRCTELEAWEVGPARRSR